MDEYLDEEEIKIEYNESFEIDPLCDKIATNPITNCDVPVENISIDPQDSVVNQTPVGK